MNYKDHWVTDNEGKEFVFTVEMQRQLSEAGLPVEPDSVGSLPPKVVQESSRAAKPRRDRPKREAVSEPESNQIDPQTGKYLGRLKWFNATKGYGFIARGGGEDIFVHKTSVIGNQAALEEGVWVLYDVVERPKGLEATDVETYEGPDVS